MVRILEGQADRVGVVGQATSNGVAYSEPLEPWPVFCLSAQQTAPILTTHRCPAGTTQAVAGNRVVAQNGKVVSAGMAADQDDDYASTAVAVDRKGAAHVDDCCGR